MINFTEDLTAIQYPGYFWSIKKGILYSIKIGGVLTPLKRRDIWTLRKFTQFGWKYDATEWYYQVSVNGHTKIITDVYLKNLVLQDCTIPVAGEKVS